MANNANENNVNSENSMLAHITNFCTDKLLEYQTAEDWENNDRTISWVVPDTNQVAQLALEPLSLKDGLYHVTIGVRRRNSDRLRSHYLEKGSRKEMIEYLKKPETRITLMASILELCEDE